MIGKKETDLTPEEAKAIFENQHIMIQRLIDYSLYVVTQHFGLYFQTKKFETENFAI
jgi:hypothetical protein